MLQKRSPWISVILIFMLLALLAFSGLPKTLGLLAASKSLPAGDAAQSQLSSAGIFDREAKGYESVLEREPDNDFALSKLLEIRLQQKNWQGAIEPLEKLISLHPEETQYRVFLAKTKLELQDTVAADRIYRQILQQQPANLEALTGIVSIYIKQKQVPMAISFLEKTLQDPAMKTQEVDAQGTLRARTTIELLLAGVYGQQENFDKAISIYDRVAKADPEDFRPLLSKALLLEQQGKTTEAKEIFQQAETIAPAGIKEQLAKLAEAT